MARPPIIDPLAVPVIGTDAHLGAIAKPRLTAESIRQRLHEREAWPTQIAGDAGHALGSAAAAAVLVPLVKRASGLQVLLTQRAEQLRDHAGQISFPGGRAEPGDRDAVDTALREAQEEVGLPRAAVEVLGELAPYTTITGFVVTPIVALVSPPFKLRIDPLEVAEAFEVPLRFLMTPAHHQRHQIEFEGRSRQFLSMPWDGTGEGGTLRRYFIWGATAAMLRNLYAVLSR